MTISICLATSSGRHPQTRQVLNYLTSLNQDFDLVIIESEPSYLSSHTIIVPQPTHYCRAKFWAAAVEAAINDIIIMMDGDRIPHPDFFTAAAIIEPNEFLYCKYLYQAPYDLPIDIINYLIQNPGHPLYPDFRVELADGTIRAAKNPMSGCTAFRRTTYQNSGANTGFYGWGFNDTDYYLSAYYVGCTFRGLDLPEIHLYHPYEISKRALLAMNAWNGVKFYDKWSLPIHADILGILKELNLNLQLARTTTLDDFITL